MQQNQVTVTPPQVSLNDTLTVKCADNHFPQTHYVILDETNRVIRKGCINDRINEFKLSMVGIAAGVYRFQMGGCEYRFVVREEMQG